MSKNKTFKNKTVSCAGKQKFRSYEEANQVLKKLRKRKSGMIKQNKERVSVYLCSFCGGFHYGGWL